MKRVHITWAYSAVFACALTFALGMQFQKMRGYHYELRSEKRVPYAEGTVAIKYVTETMGIPFLDPGTSIVTLERKSGGESTIYKAQRIFQESYPFVSDVKVNGEEFEWDDGDSRYHLHLLASERPFRVVTTTQKLNMKVPVKVGVVFYLLSRIALAFSWSKGLAR